MIICQDCGAAVEAGNRFCTRCGQPLDESAEEVPSRGSSTPIRLQNSRQTFTDPRPASYRGMANKVGGQPLRRNRVKTLLSSVAIAALVALLALKALVGFLLGLGIIKVFGLALLISLFVGAPLLLVVACIAVVLTAAVALHVLLG